MMKYAGYTALLAGFQIATFPIRAGADGRFAAILVKLNGVTAKTNPSKGRCSMEFFVGSGEYIG